MNEEQARKKLDDILERHDLKVYHIISPSIRILDINDKSYAMSLQTWVFKDTSEFCYLAIILKSENFNMRFINLDELEKVILVLTSLGIK